MTANAMRLTAKKYLASGKDDYISKAIRVDALQRALLGTSPHVGSLD